ncbi:MAG: radical SAM family heme chaperone HemW [Armatimonadetes bacterium]|nr:radical SAM family heme chaperone HemW [Armatimonadota bacterium]
MEFGLYVHIPFCPQKCFYCDFNSYVLDRGIVENYLRALEREIDVWGKRAGRLRAQTVFFGGGTPTTLPAGDIASLLDRLRLWFDIEADAEITVEANPGTADGEMFAGLKAAGVTRLSMGIQSFDDRFLKDLGRVHTAQEAVSTFGTARAAGFDNLSFDLIFGLPRQSPAHWRETLCQALELSPEHISLYGLMIEEGTRFHDLRRRGDLALPDEDTEAEMLEWCMDALPQKGYEQYEISNYARPGFRSRHNRIYWRNEPYLGFGAGAAGYHQGMRYQNHRPLRRYIEAGLAGEFPVAASETLSREAAMGETMMLGLRLLDGVNRSAFRARFGEDPAERYAPVIEKLVRAGVLAVDDQAIRLTRRGLMVASSVQAEFV